MAGWSNGDIPDLSGRIAVVTGANSGLGFVTALELARHGAAVVLACRDQERGEQARQRLLAQVPDAAVELSLLDLAELASVRSFAVSFAGRHDRLDLLVNNAGIMAIPFRRTVDGFEAQFGTNHLGHFALTGQLLPALLVAGAAGAPARVVTVSSTAHRMGRLDVDSLPDVSDPKRYSAWAAYGRSKLANLLFTAELQRRADTAGAPLLSVAAHPGFAATNLQRRGPQLRGSRLRERITDLVNAVVAQSDADGALPQLYAATMPDVHGGEYFGPSGLAESRGSPQRVATSANARDPALARRLWEESERLTRVSYDWSGALQA